MELYQLLDISNPKIKRIVDTYTEILKVYQAIIAVTASSPQPSFISGLTNQARIDTTYSSSTANVRL
mgnify:CR=1 FL=1